MWLILSLALLLRLILLNQSLWLDEAIQAQALEGALGPILQYALADFQPPLYHFILLAWTRLAGYSEIALRFPSLMAGLGSVYFAVQLGELIAGKKVAFLAGLLAATNPLLIYYSQEGRTYTLTTFFVTASMYFFLHLIQEKYHPPHFYILYSIFTVLYLWTSYLTWLFLLAFFLYSLWRRRFDLVKLQVISALTLALWLPSLLTSLRVGLVDSAVIPAWAQVVGGTSLKALALTWVKLNLGRISIMPPPLYGLSVGILALFHVFILKPLWPLSKITHPLLLWLVAPVTLASVVSLFVPVYSYTRVLFIVPAYLLLLAQGLQRLPRHYSLFCVTANLIFLSIFWFTPRFHREDWRTLTRELNAQPNIMVAIPSLKVAAPLAYYRLTQPLLSLSTLSTSPSEPLYYVRYAEDIFDSPHLGRAKLETLGYTLTRQHTYPGIALDIYVKP